MYIYPKQTTLLKNQQKVDKPLLAENKAVPIWLIVFSSLFGAFIFFSNPSLTSFFNSYFDGDEWYAVFSQSIYQPNYAYIAESILLPLLAKVVGAN